MKQGKQGPIGLTGDKGDQGIVGPVGEKGWYSFLKLEKEILIDNKLFRRSWSERSTGQYLDVVWKIFIPFFSYDRDLKVNRVLSVQEG